MNKSDQINELAAALAKVQAIMSGASKDSENPFFRSKYADLTAVWDAVRAPLSENGLSIAQVSKIAEPLFYQATDKNNVETTVMQLGVIVETVLMHSSGQWLSGECYFPIVKNDPQGVGSAITYGRRYGMKAMLGVVDEDDDGNAASGGKSNDRQVNQQTSQAPANRQTVSGTPATTGKNQTNRATANQAVTDAATKAATEKEAKINEHFGMSGAAFKKKAEIIDLCRRLSTPELAWSFAVLEEHVQNGFDKALKQLDEAEVEVLVQDLTATAEEREAIAGEPAETPAAKEKKQPAPKGSAPVADSDPATPEQVTALRRMCDIKETDEVTVMAKHGEGKAVFDDLTHGEAKQMLKHLNNWGK